MNLTKHLFIYDQKAGKATKVGFFPVQNKVHESYAA